MKRLIILFLLFIIIITVMLMGDNEITDFIKNQIKLEHEIIEVAQDSVKDVENELIKELILAIAIDSEKHASLLNALLTIKTTTTPFISEEKMKELATNIQKHIDLEAKAIETYKELLTYISDEKEKIIIKTIYQDELRHHALLKRIHKTIVEAETLVIDDEMWNLLMEDVIPRF